MSREWRTLVVDVLEKISVCHSPLLLLPFVFEELSDVDPGQHPGEREEVSLLEGQVHGGVPVSVPRLHGLRCLSYQFVEACLVLLLRHPLLILLSWSDQFHRQTGKVMEDGVVVAVGEGAVGTPE